MWALPLLAVLRRNLDPLASRNFSCWSVAAFTKERVSSNLLDRSFEHSARNERLERRRTLFNFVAYAAVQLRFRVMIEEFYQK
jgi:hypothetical protein